MSERLEVGCVARLDGWGGRRPWFCQVMFEIGRVVGLTGD